MIYYEFEGPYFKVTHEEPAVFTTGDESEENPEINTEDKLDEQ